VEGITAIPVDERIAVAGGLLSFGIEVLDKKHRTFASALAHIHREVEADLARGRAPHLLCLVHRTEAGRIAIEWIALSRLDMFDEEWTTNPLFAHRIELRDARVVVEVMPREQHFTYRVLRPRRRTAEAWFWDRVDDELSANRVAKLPFPELRWLP